MSIVADINYNGHTFTNDVVWDAAHVHIVDADNNALFCGCVERDGDFEGEVVQDGEAVALVVTFSDGSSDTTPVMGEGSGYPFCLPTRNLHAAMEINFPVDAFKRLVTGMAARIDAFDEYAKARLGEAAPQAIN